MITEDFIKLARAVRSGTALTLPKDENFTAEQLQLLLLTAAESGRSELAKMVLVQLSPEDCNPAKGDGFTILHIAAYGGYLEIVEAILAKLPVGADCNPTDNQGTTPLHGAACFGYLDIVQAIFAKLPAGADCNPANKKGETPLYRAAYYGRSEVVKAFLVKKVDANIKVKGETALYTAAQKGQTDVVKVLLTLNNIAVNDVGPTSLFTFFHDHPDIIACLREKGCLEPCEAPVQTPVPTVSAPSTVFSSGAANAATPCESSSDLAVTRKDVVNRSYQGPTSC